MRAYSQSYDTSSGNAQDSMSRKRARPNDLHDMPILDQPQPQMPYPPNADQPPPPPILAPDFQIQHEDGEDDDDDDDGPVKGKTGADDKSKAGRRKIKIEFIQDKSRRHITFSKRKAGIMKKAYELSTLTGTQVLLLVVSETGLVYTFTTAKLQPLVTQPEGKNLIQACLNSQPGGAPGSGPGGGGSGGGFGGGPGGSGSGSGSSGNNNSFGGSRKGPGSGAGAGSRNVPGGLSIGGPTPGPTGGYQQHHPAYSDDVTNPAPLPALDPTAPADPHHPHASYPPPPPRSSTSSNSNPSPGLSNATYTNGASHPSSSPSLAHAYPSPGLTNNPYGGSPSLANSSLKRVSNQRRRTGSALDVNPETGGVLPPPNKRRNTVAGIDGSSALTPLGTPEMGHNGIDTTQDLTGVPVPSGLPASSSDTDPYHHHAQQQQAPPHSQISTSPHLGSTGHPAMPHRSYSTGGEPQQQQQQQHPSAWNGQPGYPVPPPHAYSSAPPPHALPQHHQQQAMASNWYPGRR